MTDYSYIQVALLSQEGSRTWAEYIYRNNGAAPAWVADAGNPGAYLDYFLNAREAFVQWTTPEGNFFGLVTRNPFATRDGYYMVAMKVAAGFGLSGRQLVRALNALRKKLVEEKQLNDSAVADVLASAGVPAQGRSYDSWRIPPTFTAHPDAPLCYRTYVSALELENFLTFPRQQEYEAYSRVIYVAATTSLRPGVELHHVVSPIRNVYTIVPAEGVDVSRPAAAAGERVMLTYSKPGFTTIREAVVVGRPSLFVVYDGATMKVRTAAECRLTFVRRIPLNVRSAKGGVVTGFTVSVNGRPVNTMEPFLEVTEGELSGTNPVVIQVSSNNYEVLKIEKRPEELTSDATLDLVLRPIEQGITLRLDFGEGRIFEHQIALEKNTPEYSQLHSGNFHGFRAHRLTLPGCGEIYNVDVRASVKPTAPSFARVAPQAAEPQIDMRPPADARQQSAPAPEKPAPTPVSMPRADDSDEPEESGRGKMNVGLIIASVILIAVIAGAAWYFLGGWRPTPDDPASPAVVELPADSANALAGMAVLPDTTPVGAAVTAVFPAEFEADAAYLNSQGKWLRDSLKSDDGRALYDAITSGDIRGAALNPYYSVPGKATNQQAVKLIDMLWAALGTPTERSNVKCMTKYKDKAIDLHALYEDAAHYQPGERNSEPRP